MDANLYAIAAAVSQRLGPGDLKIALGLENFGQLTVPREGVMVHYDASRTDAGALNWFRDPAFAFSYNRAYTDAGRRVNLVGLPGDRSSFHRAAYHAGVCRTQTAPFPVRSANQAFYGLCITAGEGQRVTGPQYEALLADVVGIFQVHRWGASQVAARLVGHHEWAIFGPESTKRRELWGKLGRKVDPIGTNPRSPVLSLWQLRRDVTRALS